MKVQETEGMISTEWRGFSFCFESQYVYHSGDLEILKPLPPTLFKERNDNAVQTPAMLVGVFEAPPPCNVLWMGCNCARKLESLFSLKVS